MPAGETPEDHARLGQEESAQVDRDKADVDGLRGGLFHGRFRLEDRNLRAFRDVEDGVDRCPICGWELEGFCCDRCDIRIDDDGRAVMGGRRARGSQSSADDLDEDLDLVDDDGALGFHSFPHHHPMDDVYHGFYVRDVTGPSTIPTQRARGAAPGSASRRRARRADELARLMRGPSFIETVNLDDPEEGDEEDDEDLDEDPEEGDDEEDYDSDSMGDFIDDSELVPTTFHPFSEDDLGSAEEGPSDLQGTPASPSETGQGTAGSLSSSHEGEPEDDHEDEEAAPIRRRSTRQASHRGQVRPHLPLPARTARGPTGPRHRRGHARNDESDDHDRDASGSSGLEVGGPAVTNGRKRSREESTSSLDDDDSSSERSRVATRIRAESGGASGVSRRSWPSASSTGDLEGGSSDLASAPLEHDGDLNMNGPSRRGLRRRQPASAALTSHAGRRARPYPRTLPDDAIDLDDEQTSNASAQSPPQRPRARAQRSLATTAARPSRRRTPIQVDLTSSDRSEEDETPRRVAQPVRGARTGIGNDHDSSSHDDEDDASDSGDLSSAWRNKRTTRSSRRQPSSRTSARNMPNHGRPLQR